MFAAKPVNNGATSWDMLSVKDKHKKTNKEVVCKLGQFHLIQEVK